MRARLRSRRRVERSCCGNSLRSGPSTTLGMTPRALAILHGDDEARRRVRIAVRADLVVDEARGDAGRAHLGVGAATRRVPSDERPRARRSGLRCTAARAMRADRAAHRRAGKSDRSACAATARRPSRAARSARSTNVVSCRPTSATCACGEDAELFEERSARVVALRLDRS